LQPELRVFNLRPVGNDEWTAIAGIVDAIAQERDGRPEVVFDWKSDVAPAPETRQHHAAQVREYLSVTGGERGFVVYMTTGEVQEIGRNDPIKVRLQISVPSPNRLT
jgi:exodeoxyribonuclease-5